jgi:hypothetical protein
MLVVGMNDFRCKRVVQAELRSMMQRGDLPIYACPTLLREVPHCGPCVSSMLESRDNQPMPVFDDNRLVAIALICCLCESESRREAITGAIADRVRIDHGDKQDSEKLN